MKKIFKSLMAVVLMTSVMSLTGCGSKEVSPLEFLTIKCEGLDGRGTLNADFDEKAFKDALIEAAPKKKQDELKDELKSIKLERYLSLDADKKEELSNGDEVTVTMECDGSFLEDYKIKLPETVSTTYTVEGLTEPIVLDAFNPEIFNVDMDHKGVHITVTGISPRLEVKIQNDIDRNDPRSKVVYKPEYNNNYANGDEVKIQAIIGYDLDEDLYVLKEETGSITLQGYDEYVNSEEQLTDDFMDALKKECNDKMTAVLNGGNNYLYTEYGSYKLTYSNTSSIDYTWDKAYLLTLKKGISTGSYYDYLSRLFIPVEINAYNVEPTYSYMDRTKDITGVATGISLDNIVTTKNGITVTPDMLRLIDNYVGEKTVDSLVSEYVTSNVDKYDVIEIDISSWNDKEAESTTAEDNEESTQEETVETEETTSEEGNH